MFDMELSFLLSKGMMEQSKRASLSVARSILNHKLIGKKLESYLKVRTMSSAQAGAGCQNASFFCVLSFENRNKSLWSQCNCMFLTTIHVRRVFSIQQN